MWITFVFPLNAYIFLVDDTREIPMAAVVAMCVLFTVGYAP